MNKVTDDDIKKCLSDQDILRLLSYLKYKFIGQIDIDELDSITLVSLFKSLLHFDESRGMKFTSYLYLVTYRDILSHLKQLNNSKLMYRSDMSTIVDHSYNSYSLIEYLTGYTKQIFIDKYLYRMTFKEISNKHHISVRTVKHILASGKKKIAEAIGVS